MTAANPSPAPPIGIAPELQRLFVRAAGPDATPLIEVALGRMIGGAARVDRLTLINAKVRSAPERSLRIVYEVAFHTGDGERFVRTLLGRLPAGETDVGSLVPDREWDHPVLWPFRDLAAFVPELNLLLVAFPLDPALECLVEATGPGAAQILTACTGEQVSQVHACDVVRYQPERRCVLRYHIDGGSVYAKIYATDRRDVHAFQAALAAQSKRWKALRVPTPLGYDGVRHMVVTAEAPGVQPQDFVKEIEASGGLSDARRDSFGRFLDAAALALAELQSSDVRCENILTFDGELELCRRRQARAVASPYAPLVRELDEVLGLLEARGVDGEHLVPAHGGFRLGQMLFDDPAVWILDWDGFAAAGPCFDAARFVGGLRSAAICAEKRVPSLERAAARFRASFLDAQPEAERDALELYEALQLTRSALRWFRRVAPPGRAETNAARLLGEARRIISEGA